MSPKLRYLVPVPLKKALKYGYYSLQDAADFVRGQRKGLPPRRLNFVGSHDFERVGQEFFQLFKTLGGLKPSDSVLDIGCGIGRMALPLSSYLTEGRYEGFDIDRRGISWCQQNLTKRFPHFRFQYVDLYNPYYNKKGKLKSSTFAFPYEEASFDFVFATSVFTHMLPEDTAHYLEEIARVLKPGGTAFLTFFLLNSEIKGRMEKGEGNCQFRYAHDEICWYSHASIKEAELAFEEDWIRKQFKTLDLDQNFKLYPGSWSGDPKGTTYQDLIITHKA